MLLAGIGVFYVAVFRLSSCQEVQYHEEHRAQEAQAQRERAVAEAEKARVELQKLWGKK